MSDFLNSIADLSQKRLALLADGLHSKLDEVQQQSREPIAVVGMSCRFPGAPDIESFWQLLHEGRESVSEVPKERWDVNEWYDPDPETPGKMYTSRGGFLEKLDEFDPQFFAISPREAMSMDPQQRLLLELAWEAFEDAGLGGPDLRGSNTGVFASIGPSHYVGGMRVGEPEKMDMYTGIGNAGSVAMGRISFVFDLCGPNFPVETACSSSLVATHVACRSLRSRECDMALAGGVHIILAPEQTVYFCRMGVLSHKGRCSAFDAAADGFVRSEGCGMVVLKRYSDAVADGDRIRAVIRGSAINHDGRGTGLLVPNPAAQEAVIRDAMKCAGVGPADIGYVEAHGTGTPVGDPAELAALGNVFRPARGPEDPVVVGAVKTNVGHLELAAGIAGLIKTVLTLERREIPPHLHLDTPTPLADWDSLPIRIPTTPMAWEPRKGRRITGVSSYGFSGTNAHVILEEAPQPHRPEHPFDRPTHLCCLSARSEEALAEWAGRIEARLEDDEDVGLEDVCHTVNRGRSHFPCRVAFPVQSRDELRTGLEAIRGGTFERVGSVTQAPGGDLPEPVFLFTGQGAQYTDMGRVLYETQPRFRSTLDQCDALLRGRLETPLLSALHPGNDAESPLNRTAYTQPALFAIEYAMADLWRSWGIEPAGAMGHSIGEITAACVAGVMSLEDGLTLVEARGRLMQALPAQGKMAVILADEEVVEEALGDLDGVTIAAINGPDNTVISGDEELVDQVVRTLEERGTKHQYLNVSHAFHSHHMDPMLDEFEAIAAGITYSSPKIPVVSNVTGQLASDSDLVSAAYWRRHVRSPVRFADGMRCLDSAGYRLFIEMGPRPTLLGMGRKCVPESGQHWLPSLRQRKTDWKHLLDSLRELYLLGFDIDWRGFDRGYPHTLVDLPHYPFERQRYWIDAPGHGTGRRRQGAEESLLAVRIPSPIGVVQFEGALDARLLKDTTSYPLDEAHAVPTSSLINMAFVGARRAFGDAARVMERFQLHSPAAVSGDENRTLHALFHAEAEGGVRFEIFSRIEDEASAPDSWTRHAEGLLSLDFSSGNGAAADMKRPTVLATPEEEQSTGIDALDDESTLAEAAFPGLDELARRDGTVRAHFTLPETVAEGSNAAEASTEVIEMALQSLGLTSAEPSLLAPIRVGALRVHNTPGGSLWCHGRLGRGQPHSNGNLRGDVCVTDEDGNVCLELDDVVLAPLDDLRRARHAAEVARWCHDITWKPRRLAAPTPSPNVAEGYWVLFADEDGFARALGERLGDGATVTLRPGKEFIRESDTEFQVNPEQPEDIRNALKDIEETHGTACRGIVHAWSIDGDVDDLSQSILEQAARRGCASLLHLVQALPSSGFSNDLRLSVITRGARAVVPLQAETPPLDVAYAPVWGLCLSMGAEFPNLACLNIDLDPSSPASEERVVGDVAREIRAQTGEDLVAFRHGVRYVARLASMPAATASLSGAASDTVCPGLAGASGFPIRDDATYLITGGFGGIGLIMARWLCERGARHLVLLGRRGATEESRSALEKLEQQGVHVYEGKADVADRESLQRVLDEVSGSAPPLRGILHAAGVLDEGLLAQRDWDQMKATLAPKVAGTWNLHELTRDAGLDFFVLFSSTSTLFRTPGLGPYAAANSFLDAMAHYRRSIGLPATSVHWGSWLEAGMAARRQETETKWGIGSIDPEGGTLALDRALRAGWTEVGVVPVDWDAFAREAPDMYQAPFLHDMLPEKAVQAAQRRRAKGADPVLMELRTAGRERRIEILTDYIRQKIAKVVGLDSIEELDPDTPLANLGLDSLMGFEIKSAIELAIGQTIPVAAMLENPTIANVVLYLVDEVMEDARTDAPVQEETAPQVALDPKLWLPFEQIHEKPALRLVCLPYSGAGASCYRPWIKAMPRRIELQAVQYPGRETRIKEPLLQGMAPLVEAIESVLLPDLEEPYALFGHSMGAMVALSLAQQIQRHGRPLPRHVFLSGCATPRNQRLPRSVADLSDEELLAELRKYGHTSEKVLENSEMMGMYLPVIRADFTVCESFRPDPENPLACPLTVYGGTADSRVKPLHLSDWHSWAAAGFDVELFDGDHFFIHDPENGFLQSLTRKLAGLL